MRKARQRKIALGTQCKQCGAQHGGMVYRSLTRAGLWTDEPDLADLFPGEWSSELKSVTLVAAIMLCLYCSAHPELADKRRSHVSSRT